PQRLAAAWNGGQLHFADVSGALHLDRAGQFIALTVTDLDGDGAPDLIAGGSQEPPRVYHNEIQGGGALSLRLRGTTSNPLGLGARLALTTPDGKTQHAVCGSLIGANVMSEPLVFFGMGSAASGRLDIDWPS